MVFCGLFRKFAVHRCHANAVAKWADQNMEGDWKPDCPKNTTTDKINSKLPHSYKSVPLVMPNNIRQYLQTEKYETSPLEYRPEQEMLPATCQCGSDWKSYDEPFTTGTYYTTSFVKNVMVYCRNCVNDKCKWHYDGQQNGVFNYSGETLISYTMLHEFFNCCVRNSMSWAGFLNKTNHMYNDIYSLQEEKMQSMSSHTFTKVCTKLYTPVTSTSLLGCFGILEANFKLHEH